jgi:hypothetical protein
MNEERERERDGGFVKWSVCKEEGNHQPPFKPLPVFISGQPVE